MCSDKDNMLIFEDFTLEEQYHWLRWSSCFQQCYFFSRKKPGDLRGQIKLQTVDISFSYCLGPGAFLVPFPRWCRWKTYLHPLPQGLPRHGGFLTLLHQLLELLPETKSSHWLSHLVWLGTRECFETEHGATANGQPYGGLCHSALCMLCLFLPDFLHYP